jgi:hypothetical protein
MTTRGRITVRLLVPVAVAGLGLLLRKLLAHSNTQVHRINQ